MYLTVIAIISFLVWVWLFACRGNFWRADQRLSEAPAPLAWPHIAAIIPARDEAETIDPVITSHLASRYPGKFTVILVDDQSSDGTAALAQNAAMDDPRFHLMTAPPLAVGWTGKLWAMRCGVEHAREVAPKAQYFLFTDADIVHDANTLTKLAAKAEAECLSLTSLMARLDARGVWGVLLIPAFIYFFQKLYPFPQANDPWHDIAAAAGGCMLVRRRALERTGGAAAIKGDLIDDCALARQIKGDAERRIWLGLADEEVISLRDNRSLSSIWTMVSRTAFTQLDYSWLKLIGTVIAMTLIYLAPPVIAITWPLHDNSSAAFIAIAAWLIMAITYRPTATLYQQNWLKIFALPAAALFYTLMTITSAWKHLRGRGGQWKGRAY